MSRSKARINNVTAKIKAAFDYHEVEYTEAKGQEYFNTMKDAMQCGNAGTSKFISYTDVSRLRVDKHVS